ncbi:MAG: GNAT family N-acetyltransferase [Limnobacter sp.]|uniref:GNAT family N-acetyltransferase n=1 Tax=Limnobacter sp. TaxID=2003368 RepID=UPI00391AC485
MSFPGLVLKSISEVAPELYAGFDCPRPELVDFLVRSALDYELDRLSNTYLAFREGMQEVVGYYSLASDAITLSEFEEFESSGGLISLRAWPAVKLTKLAVASSYQRQGVGSELIEFAVGMVYDAPMACRFITTDAVNESDVIAFYEARGFVRSMHAENQNKSKVKRPTILMFKDIMAED